MDSKPDQTSTLRAFADRAFDRKILAKTIQMVGIALLVVAVFVWFARRGENVPPAEPSPGTTEAAQ